MRKFKTLFNGAARLFAVMMLIMLMLPSSAFAAIYEDGTYYVPVSLSGGSMGHNDIVSPCTVHVENGAIYADIVMRRVTSPWHAPRYDWMATSEGTVVPTTNESDYTQTFSYLPLPNLETVGITTSTSAMSEAHEISYTLYFDASSVPLKSENSGSSSPEPQAEPQTPSAPSAQSGSGSVTSGQTSYPAQEETELSSDSDIDEGEERTKPEEKEQTKSGDKTVDKKESEKKDDNKKGDKEESGESETETSPQAKGQTTQTARLAKGKIFIIGAALALLIATMGIVLLIKGERNGKLK